MSGHVVAWLAPDEEILLAAGKHREKVIIEVQELLVQAFDPVKEHLDCLGIEDRQQFRRYDVRVTDNPQLLTIDPRWDLGVSRDHEIDIADERHIHTNAAKQILQRAPVAETFLQESLHPDAF